MTSSDDSSGITSDEVRPKSAASASRDSLQIEAIEIQAAPGFEAGGFSIEGFADGVTVVHGPNASGKTTLARSIQSLLWPETAAKRTSLTGQFRTGTDDWWVDLTRRRGEYQKNGASANPPNLPSKDNRERYRLALHDLLQGETNGTSFAELIQQESIGGYDLNAAYDSLGFEEKPSSKRIGEYSAATDAKEEWKKARRDEQRLKERQSRLPQLKRERENARTAKERVELLERTIEYRKAVTEFEKAKAAVDEFPDAVADLQGSEADDVERLTEQLEDARGDLRDATSDRADARAAIFEAELPEGGGSDAVIAKLKHRQSTLESLEDKRSATVERLAAAKKRRTAAAADIPLELDTEGDALAGLSPAGWEEIEAYLRETTRATSRRETVEAINSWLETQEVPDADLSTLQNGQRALEEWLSEPPSTTGDAAIAKKAFRVGVASAGAVAATAITLGALVNPAFLLLLVLAVGVLWYAWTLRSTQGQSGKSSARETYQASFRRLDLAEPDSWEPEDVRRRLESLYEAIARAKLGLHVESLHPDANELEEDETDLAERRAELKDRYGAAPDSTDPELVAITKGILRWQEEHAEVESVTAELAAVEEQIAETIEELETTLAPFGYETVDDAASAAGYIEEITNRNQAYKIASQELTDSRKRAESARKTIKRLTGERREVYEDRGLQDGEFEQLSEFCEQVDAYQDAAEKLNRKRSRRDDKAEELEAHHAYESDLEDRSLQELKAERDEADETARQFDELDDEIRDIEADIRSAKRGSAVEDKKQAFTRALEDLESRYNADRAALVGDALFEHLRETTEEASRPAVFSRADELFITITHGQYELLLDDGAFRAKDTVRDRGFALDELSSATRLQLLLAVRVAFVEHQENGFKLPLLLDETLANADDERAEAIIESIVELARDGRQVIYFTAQGDEVAKWQRVLAQTEDVTETTIDLAKQRGLSHNVEIPSYEELIPSTPELPEPDEHDYQSYGEALEVPPFAPREGARSAHLWYIVGETEVLHTLLTVGVERWGQLKTLLDSDVGLSVVDTETQERTYHHGLALEEYVKSWQIGRGKPVDQEVLVDSGAVSSNFIKRVSSLAKNRNGDAEAILDGLRNGDVSRFHSDKMDELEQYFRDNGYIQEVEALSPDTIIMRVIGQFTSNGYSPATAREHAEALFRRLQNRSNQSTHA